MMPFDAVSGGGVGAPPTHETTTEPAELAFSGLAVKPAAPNGGQKSCACRSIDGPPAKCIIPGPGRLQPSFVPQMLAMTTHSTKIAALERASLRADLPE